MGKDIWKYRTALGSLFHILPGRARGVQAHTLSAAKVDVGVEGEQVNIDSSKWRSFNSRALGICNSKITAPTWTVLRSLREKGWVSFPKHADLSICTKKWLTFFVSGSDAYLVGGCVRDIILKKRPKDFDVITNADPTQIMKRFRKCHLVGKRFPVCLVQIQDSIIEVASFGSSEKLGSCKIRSFPLRPPYCSPGDYIRWKDCMRRDFTINGLMYDPFANLVYDYTGGMEDIKRAKVRTVIPAHVSFEEDYGRILRAFRVAGRLGFEFTSDTACAIEDLSRFILKLDKSRLMMEMNYMLAYGAAEASFRLLKRFGVLEILLPFQAAYLSSQGFKRSEKCYKQANMLLDLLSNLDKLLASDRPCHNSLWVGLLAFHSALVNKPQDALVLTAFSFAMYYGGDLKKAMDTARKIVQTAKKFSPEIGESKEFKSDELVSNEVLNLASAARSSLISMVYKKVPSKAACENPYVHASDVVFISKAMHSKVVKIFDVPEANVDHTWKMREPIGINYKLLGYGVLQEVQFAFAKIVLDTLYVNIADALNLSN